MGFVKVVKNNAYFKRYQVKYRRRRQCKTDYQARKALIHQNRDKYDRPKYRLVVRITNSKVICQIIYAEIIGDKVVQQATSAELKKFGLTAGLTNYASAYATGLLLARRLLADKGLDKQYSGNKDVNGEYYCVDDIFDNGDAERRPFKAVLDIGLVRTTTGNKVFAALKGACDGGIFVPHSEDRFPGYYDEEEGSGFEAEVLRDRIFGAHVDKYIEYLKGDKEAYKRQFSKWSDCLTKSKSKSVADLYKSIHQQIYKSPAFTKKAAKTNPKRDHSKLRDRKTHRAGRRDRALKMIKIRTEQLKAKANQ